MLGQRDEVEEPRRAFNDKRGNTESLRKLQNAEEGGIGIKESYKMQKRKGWGILESSKCIKG